VNALRARVAAGETFRYLCFWSHRGCADGAPSAACFSQWFPAPFTVDGLRYATAEHWMMAEKARLFGDEAAVARVFAQDDPVAAKAAGRTVRGFDETMWQRHRFDIVVTGNRAKFGQHPALAAFLAGTGDRILVEASPVDAVRGIGLAAADPGAHDPERWHGAHLLGFALMDVRARLGGQA
jgi:ribA/ribD-fused uncharacterized protein